MTLVKRSARDARDLRKATKRPARHNAVVSMSLPQTTFDRMDELKDWTNLTRSAVVTLAVAELHRKEKGRRGLT